MFSTELAQRFTPAFFGRGNLIPTDEEKKQLPYAVFKRGDSGTYAVRFTLPDLPQIRIGLATRDEAEAYRKAAREHMEASIRHENGLLVGPASFDKLSRGYLDALFKDAQRNPKRLGHARHARSTVERYLLPFFKKMSIGGIGHAKLIDYLEWRKTYWTEGPGKDIKTEEFERAGKKLNMRFTHREATESTLKREANFLRAIFKHAVQKGYLKRSDIPKIEVGKVRSNKRPAFSKQQFAQLEQVAIQQLTDARNLEIDATDKADHEKRLADKSRKIFESKQIVEFIYIAVQTGMRPGELFNLNWGHIQGLEDAPLGELQDRNIRIFAQGKAKKGNLIPAAHTANSFLQLMHAYKERFGNLPKDTDPVFCDAVGNRIRSLNKHLNKLLDAADLRYNEVEEKFSTYSFRHSYATWQLQKSNPVDIYTLAINMRTSVEMIEKYYSDVIPEDKADVLRGDTLSRRESDPLSSFNQFKSK